MSKSRWQKIAGWLIWLSLGAASFVTLAFVSTAENEMLCKKLIVKIDNQKNESYFVEKEDVLVWLNEKAFNLVGSPASLVNVRKIEEVIARNPYVENAEVFMTVHGELSITIRQRVPILRVILDDGESYYLDSYGVKMPLSEKYVPRVLVSTGYISANALEMERRPILLNEDSLRASTHNLIDTLLMLAQNIKEDEFMNAQCEQIFITASSELEIIPKIGKHVILLGDISHLHDKFYRLKLFTQKTILGPEWNSYSTVDLRYFGQVVCTKKTDL